MGKYDKKGGYAGYDKNNKEREPFDYYATPPEEVTNIIKILKPWDLDNNKEIIILEPCADGGHMIKGIRDSGFEGGIIGTDIAKHPQIKLQYGDIIIGHHNYGHPISDAVFLLSWPDITNSNYGYKECY